MMAGRAEGDRCARVSPDERISDNASESLWLSAEMDNCIRELALARTLWACGGRDGVWYAEQNSAGLNE